jgi:hypothetical protein
MNSLDQRKEQLILDCENGRIQLQQDTAALSRDFDAFHQSARGYVQSARGYVLRCTVICGLSLGILLILRSRAKSNRARENRYSDP